MRRKVLTLPVSILLPIELTNRNDGQGHGHWRTGADRKAIENVLRSLGHVYDPTNLPPVALTVTRIWGKRARAFDEDSLARGNAKQLIDSMVACGWLINDCRPHVMQCDYRQRKATDGVAAVLIEMVVYDGGA